MKNDVFKHPQALVESDTIGDGTRIWAFAHVLKGAVIGRNCNIGDHCFVESNVKIGDDVVVKNGVAIWDEVTIENLVFIGPNVVFTNDMFPRSKLFRENYIPTLVKEGASIGANATLLCGNTIGKYAMIGAGAVVIRDVDDFALVVGNPARKIGHVCVCSARLNFSGNDCKCRDCGREYRMNNDKKVELISL